MANVTFIIGGEPAAYEAKPGQTLAEIAKQSGIPMYGSCQGQNICCQCSRRVVEGLANLLRKTGEPYVLPENAAPYVRTCQIVPSGDVTVDCDSRGRF